MGGVTGVLEPVTRPRFPLEWLEREEPEPPRPPRHRLEWRRLLMFTVVAVTGRATTAALDFGQTSVFHHRDGVGSIAHLKLGQQVRLLQERGVAKSIEILREPIPSLLP